MTGHIISDSKGKELGVYIPIDIWNEFKSKHPDLIDSGSNDKAIFLKEFSESLDELKQILNNELEGRSAREFINEL